MNKRRPRWLADLFLLTVAAAAFGFVGRVHAAEAPRVANGRIEGRVVVSVPVAAPPPSAAYGTRRIAKRDAGGSEVSNVVVFLKNAPKPAALPVMRASILQQNETFVPRVVAITRGSTVDFPNGDPFFHDVFSLSLNGTFDLGSYSKGKTKSQTFRRAGLIKVYCHIHSHMTASIMVLDHPYFSVPKADGTFALDDIPPGSYTVSAWHERIGESQQAVRVESGRTSDVQFSLPIGPK